MPKTDHFTYVWITPFVIDYMHHIDGSAAMRYNYHFGCSILHFLVIIHTLCGAGVAVTMTMTTAATVTVVAVNPFHDNKMQHTHTQTLHQMHSREWIVQRNKKTAHKRTK